MNENIAIIGAGLAGIAAARGLVDRGHTVTIFEKSRGFGGRCASKRWLDHIVDHGAQYFTMRDARFRAAVESACGSNLRPMTAPILDQHGQVITDHGRWFHAEGNSRLARDLARGIEVKTQVLVADAQALLKTNGGNFDHVVSSAPWPQTAELFGMTSSIHYAPCLTALFAYEGEWLGSTAEAYAISDHTSDLAWSACENHKPARIASGSTVLVAQMSPSFSIEHLEIAANDIPDLIRPILETRWQLPQEKFRAALGHRWRYARMTNAKTLPSLPTGMHYVGDAVSGSRVESAWLDGLRLAENFLVNTVG
jgi:renalase